MCAFCACLSAILILVASAATLADVHWVPDGWAYAEGAASADGWGASCSASAFANSAYPYSWAIGHGAVLSYTDFGGWFHVSYDCTASASASFTDEDHSGASGGGGGEGSVWGFVASMQKGGSSGGLQMSWADGDTDPGYGGETLEGMWFDAFSGVGAECTCYASASIGDPNGPNHGSGYGQGYADVGLNTY